MIEAALITLLGLIAIWEIIILPILRDQLILELYSIKSKLTQFGFNRNILQRKGYQWVNATVNKFIMESNTLDLYNVWLYGKYIDKTRKRNGMPKFPNKKELVYQNTKDLTSNDRMELEKMLDSVLLEMTKYLRKKHFIIYHVMFLKLFFSVGLKNIRGSMKTTTLKEIEKNMIMQKEYEYALAT